MEGKDPVIVVLISGNGSNLQALIDAVKTEEIAGNIAAVISNEESAYGLSRAKEANIKTHVLDHRQHEKRESYSAELIKLIEPYQPDLIVLAGFMRILSTDFVQYYEGQVLNIHPSLLPKYPGLKTHQRAIDAGDTEHGTSVHFVSSELDSGPNIIQAKVPILKQDTAETLALRIRQQEHIIYPIAVKWFIDGRILKSGETVTLDGNTLPESGLTLNDLQTIH